MADDMWMDEPALLHCVWRELIETAGCQAGRELATRCAPDELRESGDAWIHVEPVDSPVASWLYRNGYGSVTESHEGVLVPVRLDAARLSLAEEAARKARSLLVAQAYAHAYCSVLAEEAGVTAGPVVERDRPARVPAALESAVLPARDGARAGVSVTPAAG